MSKLWHLRLIVYSLLASISFITLSVVIFHFMRWISWPNVGLTTGLKMCCWQAYLWNILLVALFSLQHSGMASSPWKRAIDYCGLHVLQRSIFVLATAITLQVLMWYWAGTGLAPVWFVTTTDRPWLWFFFASIHCLCWFTIYAECLTMDLPELLGLKQVYYWMMDAGEPMTYKAPEACDVYSHMRHPGMAAFGVLLWLHPVMTVERIVLAIGFSLYTTLRFQVSEADCRYLDEQYRRKYKN